jgi:hypothetical protein
LTGVAFVQGDGAILEWGSGDRCSALWGYVGVFMVGTGLGADMLGGTLERDMLEVRWGTL